ncbi:hypothetical protein RhiirA1_477516 [Rhizophagus irregularis]|uniref:Uncharacterized protein n=1 Tax=Rhizophagus irregularis TaxID=588596 RepID=A0A2N0QTF7_9GLOM|nr:hypothetical protein RhiirA1_477516 [Rhizophagus irregularis]
MGCRRSKTSQKKSQARFKVLKAARKSQLRQLEVDFSGSFRLADGGEVKQLKRENKSAMYSTKYFENKYYHAMSVIQKYGMIVVDDNMPKSPSPIPSSSSSSFSSSSYDQIFVADGPDYINNNNDNNNDNDNDNNNNEQ